VAKHGHTRASPRSPSRAPSIRRSRRRTLHTGSDATPRRDQREHRPVRVNTI